MLTSSHVEFAYPGQPVFSDLNFELKQGEFSFLIGKSGAGKSTLLQLIYMNIFPVSGYIEVSGYNSDNISQNDIPFLRRKLGIVFQDFRLLEDRNVYDNLEFVLKVTGVRKTDIKKKILNALADVGLSHKRNQMPQNLSGGEKQRVAIARAIINEPKLILADEPTGNLDPETSEEILNLIKKINSGGTSVLFATHNYELVKQFDTKIIKIADGKAVEVKVRKKAETA
ncbi:MAG: cell division ATP-binding protein FtsE [Ignavibacteria bacterium]|nr:cell division ATP-binding protein FtsE [Ignavibacteria bacterium]